MKYKKLLDKKVMGFGYHILEDMNKHKNYMESLGWGLYTVTYLGNVKDSEYTHYCEYVRTIGEGW